GRRWRTGRCRYTICRSWCASACASRGECSREGPAMKTVPEAIHRRLRQYGQEHVLAWWDRLTDAERHDLMEQIEAIDLEQLRRLYAERDKGFAGWSRDKIAPVPVIPAAEDAE